MRATPGRLQCFHFRMRPTEAAVVALAHDLAVRDDHAADHWVRLDMPATLFSQVERTGHRPRF
jgi:hypothetical protein